MKDGSGFFYSRYDAPKEGEALNGREQQPEALLPQARDAAGRGHAHLRASRPARVGPRRQRHRGRPLARHHRSKGTDNKNRSFLKDLTQARQPRGALPGRLDAYYRVVGQRGRHLLRHDQPGCAPRNRLVAIRRAKPEPRALEDDHPAGQGKDVLESRRPGRRAASSPPGCRMPITPWSSTIPRASRRAARRCPRWARLAASAGAARTPRPSTPSRSFTYPGTIYRYDLTTGKSTVFRRRRWPSSPADYETEQVFYPQQGRHEGAHVPGRTRRGSSSTARTRPCSTATAASTSR